MTRFIKDQSHTVAARRAGANAWESGRPLDSCPFEKERERAEWMAWRLGWIRASEDHLEKLQSS